MYIYTEYKCEWWKGERKKIRGVKKRTVRVSAGGDPPGTAV